MDWLVFLFALELGWSPQLGVLQYEPYQAVYAEDIMYTELQAELEFFGFLFAGGGVKTYITPSGKFNFAPNTTIYDFKAGLRLSIFEVGWRHRCFHPTFPYQPIFNQELTGLEGGYDEVYLRISNHR